MNIISILWMKTKYLITGVMSCVFAGIAAPSPAKLCSDLERHLRSLRSLEVRYEAEGTTIANGGISGHLIWTRPDKFYHDTPEWTLCEIGSEQWRHLKTQNTLIREVSNTREQWTPEHVLFDLGKNFRPASVDERDDGARVLWLASSDANVSGNVTLVFPPGSRVPDQIHIQMPDETETDYFLVEWNENIVVDSGLFAPPEVPAENVIDFRAAKEGAR